MLTGHAVSHASTRSCAKAASSLGKFPPNCRQEAGEGRLRAEPEWLSSYLRRASGAHAPSLVLARPGTGRQVLWPLPMNGGFCVLLRPISSDHRQELPRLPSRSWGVQGEQISPLTPSSQLGGHGNFLGRTLSTPTEPTDADDTHTRVVSAKKRK